MHGNLIAELEHVSHAAQFASSVVKDCTGVPDAVKSMSTLGTSGKWKQNAERDLHRWCRNLNNSRLEKYALKFELELPDDAEPVDVDIHVLNPFDICHSLYIQGPAQFEKSMIGGGGRKGIIEFWQNALREKWAKNHPFIIRNLYMIELLFPVTYHLDGAEVHRNSEMMFFSLGNPLVQYGQTNSLDAKFCLVAISHELWKVPGAKRKLLDILTRWIDWNHKIFDSGKMPDKGFYNEDFPKSSQRYLHKGEEIMGGWKAVYMGTKADGKA